MEESHSPTQCDQEPQHYRGGCDRFVDEPEGSDDRPRVVLSTPMVSMREFLITLSHDVLQPTYLRGKDLLDGCLRVLTREDAKRTVERYALSESEALACAAYTASCGLFREANRHMRSGDVGAAAPFLPFLSWLLCGLQKLESYDGVAFRVWDTKDITSGMHVGAGSYIIGSTVRYTAFSSASMSLTSKLLENFGGKDGGTVLAMNVVGARRICPLSFFPQEGEVVLLPGWTGTVRRSLDRKARITFHELGGIDIRDCTVVELQQEGLSESASITASALGFREGVDPENSSNLSHVGLAHLFSFILHDHEKAKLHYEKALQADQSNAAAHEGLADLLTKYFSDDNGAIEHYKAALQIDSLNLNAHVNLANLLADRFGDLEGARAQYQAALCIDPREPRATAALLLNSENKERAAQLIEAAIEQHKYHSSALVGTAAKMQHVGGPLAAKNQYAAA